MFDPMAWVDLRCHQYPENVLLADLGWGFHPKITPLKSEKNRGKKIGFYSCKKGQG